MFNRTMGSIVVGGLLLAGGLPLSCSEGDAEPADVATTGGPGEATAPVSGASVGAALFRDLCVTCHGETGRGDGPMSKMLSTKPRSLVDEAYMYIDESEPREKILAGLGEVIVEGLPDAGMTSFGERLSAEEIRAVAEYVLGLRER